MAHAGESPSGSGSSVGEIEFRSREDVEKLLNEKMKGEDKMGYKSQCETQMDYIKKLRSCIKWFGDLEDKHLMEEEKLRSMLESVERKYAEMEAEMKRKVEELNAALEEVRWSKNSITEHFKEEEKAMADVKSRDALPVELPLRMQSMLHLERYRIYHQNSLNENTKLRQDVSSLRELIKSEEEAIYSAQEQLVGLIETITMRKDCQNTTEELQNAQEQMTSLQDITKRIEEWRETLTRDHLKLHVEAKSLRETISKLEEEVNARKQEQLVHLEVVELQSELHDTRHLITLLEANLDHRMATAASQGERRAQIQEDTDMDG